MHRSDFDISLAQPTDLKRLAELFMDFKQLAETKSLIYDRLTKNPEHAILTKLETAISDNAHLFCVAREGDDICGFVLAYVEALPDYYEISKIGHITDLFVTKACRRRGMGTALLRACESGFAKQGIDHVRIETTVVNADNKDFYESLGYELFIYELRKSAAL